MQKTSNWKRCMNPKFIAMVGFKFKSMKHPGFAKSSLYIDNDYVLHTTSLSPVSLWAPLPRSILKISANKHPRITRLLAEWTLMHYYEESWLILRAYWTKMRVFLSFSPPVTINDSFCSSQQKHKRILKSTYRVISTQLSLDRVSLNFVPTLSGNLTRTPKEGKCLLRRSACFCLCH